MLSFKVLNKVSPLFLAITMSENNQKKQSSDVIVKANSIQFWKCKVVCGNLRVHANEAEA